LTPVEVNSETSLTEPLALLEESLRDGKPVSRDFANRLRKSIQAGNVEVLAAREEDRIVGVLLLAYRLNVSAGAHFASIEDLYVRPDIRRQGVGRALLEAVNERCVQHRISYVEVQVEDDRAESFYVTLGYEAEPSVKVLSQSLAIPETFRL
jgi:GNAT superfamily N-acetyltransferase